MTPAETDRWRAHPVLGARLVECTALMLAAEKGKSALEILGSPDDVKFRSSMTLFDAVAAAPPAPFAAALERYFDDVRDPATLALLRRH